MSAHPSTRAARLDAIVADANRENSLRSYAGNDTPEGSGTLLPSTQEDFFYWYLAEFPCFADFALSASVQQIYDQYHNDQLSDEQDVVLEFLLELLNPEQQRCSFADCFHILDSANRAALLRILQFHHEQLNHLRLS